MSLALLRKATPSDLPHFEAFANEAGPGITSLPRERSALEEMCAQPHRHLFCLELEGEVVGASGIISRIGLDEPFFAYHCKQEHLSAPSLGIERDEKVLHFIEARKKPTEIGTLFLHKAHRGQGYGPLLSFARFLYIALFRDQFADTVIAEMRGVNREGKAPLWEAIGRHFFDCDFSAADHLRITDPDAVKALFPKHPIYVSLLPKEAQKVLGRAHPNTQPAVNILETQGFMYSDYVDIFDGGPHIYAPTDEIKTIKESKRFTIQAIEEGNERALIANTRPDFRACRGEIDHTRGTVSRASAEALNVDIGEEVIFWTN